MGKGWAEVKLGEVLAQVRREETLQPDREYAVLGAHWYAHGLYTKEIKPGSSIKAAKAYRVEEGDFVYNRLFAWKGSFAVASAANAGCYVSNEFPCFDIARDRLEPRFLWHYFRREAAWNEALGLSHGATPTSRNRLKEARLLAMQIPLPPLSEQRRIVAKIDRLAEKIEEARGLRQACQKSFHSLTGAVAGSQFAARGMKQPVAIGDLAQVKGGIQKTPSRTPRHNAVRYLTVAHVQRNRIDQADARYFEVLPQELERRALQAGDVLIIEGNGSADQIGRTALYRGELDPCVHQNHVIRIRPKVGVVIPEYLNAFLNSPPGQAELQARSRTTSP